MTGIAQEAPAQQRELSSAQHFEVMDGLRGVAAMAVVFFHSFGKGGLVLNGPLAVDLFFILSGFVIAYSYDHRLRSGMAVSDFIAKRLIRLYPMVLIGALGGILIALVHNKTNPAGAYPLGSIATSGGLSLALLPYLGHAISDEAFSFDPPLWSLFFEIAANLAYVIFARRLSNIVLVVIVLLGLAGVVVGGSLGGNVKATILLGFPRVACGFFGGVLLCRFWRAGKLPKINGNFFALAAIIFAIFLMPKLIGGWAFLPIYGAFVAVIVCAAGAKSSLTDKYCALLGEVSYPLYVLHWLTLYIFTWVGLKVGLAGPKYPILAVIHLLCAPVIAYFAARYYEMPLRRLLANWWKNDGTVKNAPRIRIRWPFRKTRSRCRLPR
jgi:peptidoglycan/LPS O-acetylase OafA/YrhL